MCGLSRYFFGNSPHGILRRQRARLSTPDAGVTHPAGLCAAPDASPVSTVLHARFAAPAMLPPKHERYRGRNPPTAPARTGVTGPPRATIAIRGLQAHGHAERRVREVPLAGEVLRVHDEALVDPHIVLLGEVVERLVAPVPGGSHLDWTEALVADDQEIDLVGILRLRRNR